MKEGFDLEDVCLVAEVDSEVIEQVRDGRIMAIGIELTEKNQDQIVETVDGHLILVIEDMPTTYHGCYLYNNGEFPYAIKDDLEFVLLNDGKERCLTKIIGMDTEPGTRFRFQGSGEPSVEDPDGDSCIWEISFEVVPVPREPRHYLMRWNPTISSFTEKDFEKCLENQVHGMFRMDWSIYDWQEARRGDMFYMMRTGDDKAGIAFSGQFICDPYPGDDWAGSNKRRMYVDMVCMNPMEPGEVPDVTLEKLQKAIPEYEWTKGHSGELLQEDVADKLSDLFDSE
jgi:hypothetical protein